MSDMSLTDLRKRVVDGEPVTLEEYKQVIAGLRRDRSAAKPGKKKKESQPTLDLPADLKDLF